MATISDEKVALVVGGGTGMGFAAAGRLAARGLSIVLAGRRSVVLAGAKRKIETARPRAAVAVSPGDAGIEAQAAAMVATAIDHFGRLDILVGAAGTLDAVGFGDLDEDSWRSTMTATLDSMVFPAIAAVRQMKKQGSGNIVLISSVNTTSSEPGVAAYNTAKAAIGGLVRSIVVDCAGDGIQANAVAPGWVYTPMTASYVDEGGPGMLERVNPLGRAADADEIGNVVEYLSLDAPRFLTGSTIVVDGGQTIRAAMV